MNFQGSGGGGNATSTEMKVGSITDGSMLVQIAQEQDFQVAQDVVHLFGPCCGVTGGAPQQNDQTNKKNEETKTKQKPNKKPLSNSWCASRNRSVACSLYCQIKFSST